MFNGRAAYNQRSAPSQLVHGLKVSIEWGIPADQGDIQADSSSNPPTESLRGFANRTSRQIDPARRGVHSFYD